VEGKRFGCPHALKTAHATAMLALTGGFFIIFASEKQRD